MTGFIPPPPRQTKRARFHIDMTVEMPAELAVLPATVKEPSAEAMRSIYRHAFKGLRLAHGEDLRLVTGSFHAQLDFRSADPAAETEAKLKTINEGVRDFTGEEDDAIFAAAADTFERLDSELNRINAEAKALRDRLEKRIFSATDAEIEAELIRMGVDPKGLDARARQFIAAIVTPIDRERNSSEAMVAKLTALNGRGPNVTGPSGRIEIGAQSASTRPAPLTEEARCTGQTAVWCPIHGDCSCPYLYGDPANGRTLDDDKCPLHKLESAHGEEVRTPEAVLLAMLSAYEAEALAAMIAHQKAAPDSREEKAAHVWARRVSRNVVGLRSEVAAVICGLPVASNWRDEVRDDYEARLSGERPIHAPVIRASRGEVPPDARAPQTPEVEPGDRRPAPLTVERTWDGPRRYHSDDRDLDGHDLDFVIIPPSGNGDWYVAIVPHGHKPWTGVRITTSGVPRKYDGFFVALANAYEKLPPNTETPPEAGPTPDPIRGAK